MLERVYTIPIRKYLTDSPKWRKSEKAMFIVEDFLKKHMKSDKIKVDKSVTEKIWERGGQKPPSKLRVVATKDDEGLITVKLFEETSVKEEVSEEKPKEKSTNK